MDSTPSSRDPRRAAPPAGSGDGAPGGRPAGPGPSCPDTPGPDTPGTGASGGGPSGAGPARSGQTGSGGLATGQPAEEQVLFPVYRVLMQLRWLLLVQAVVVDLERLHRVGHPVVLVACCVLMVGWTAVLTLWTRSAALRRWWLMWADGALCLALVLTSRWVLGGAADAETFLTVPVYWASTWPLAVAIGFGAWWGLAAGALGVLAKLVQEPRVDDRVLGAVVVTVISVWGVGTIVGALKQNVAEREATRAREAALAERDRMNRIVHDGVLQVLAMVEREGPELGPRGEQLAAMARQQGILLRNRLREREVEAPTAPGGVRRLDVGELLEAHQDDRVTVSVADPVRMAEPRARELEQAVAEALANVRHHAGPQARAWVLLERIDDEVTVTVRDNGLGMTREQVEAAQDVGRLGVRGSIIGRIADIGGTAVARSRLGHGVEWEFVVPTDEAYDAGERQ